MHQAQYGYYIHGRSVYGKADTNMKEMFEMMKKEEVCHKLKRGYRTDLKFLEEVLFLSPLEIFIFLKLYFLMNKVLAIVFVLLYGKGI